MKVQNLSKYIDHTLLKQDAKKEDIIKLCKEALEYNFASVCINPCYAELAKSILNGSDIKVCSVAGFPLGANTIETKISEIQHLYEIGCQEVDMVINISSVKNNDFEYFEEEIKKAVDTRDKFENGILKVIIETCLLTKEEIAEVSKILYSNGVDFIKTSTGFSTGGAKEDDIRIIRSNSGPDAGIKASGGVRSLEDCLKMIEAGATRIGTSSGIKIMNEADDEH